MKILSIVALASILACTSYSYAGLDEHEIDVYDIKIHAIVPRIYNNTESLGTRRWQRQSIVGEMWVDYTDVHTTGHPDIRFYNVTNRTHKIGSSNVTYTGYADTYSVPVIWAVQGNNRTDVFKQAACSFYMILNPSYNIGDDSPDNTLLLMVSASGNLATKEGRMVLTRMSGYCAGRIGCGCTAYGHKSPTRVLGYGGPIMDMVTDISGVKGTFRATLNKSRSDFAKKHGMPLEADTK